jgi:titin
VTCGAEPLEPRRLLATFTVTTEADEGPGSLRQAILDANGLAGPDGVHFDLPGEGLRTISPASLLPDVTDPLTIDASTQPGYAGSPRVRLDGVSLTVAADGLALRALTAVRGLIVTRFRGSGVAFLSGGGRLEGCYVGVVPSGLDSFAAGNSGAGVFVNTPGVTVGGSLAGHRNIISGNGGPGVLVRGVTAESGPTTTLWGNYIGTSANGARRQPNGQEGVLVEASSGVRIGAPEPALRNVISGNSASGIRLAAGVSEVTIHGNFIGTTAAGNAALPNGTSNARLYRDGITTAGADIWIGGNARSPGGNVISANPGSGIAVLGGTCKILGNFIGTDSTGARVLTTTSGAGQMYGVRVAGGVGVVIGERPSSPRSLRNVISGNAGSGILIEGVSDAPAYVEIQDSYIGTDATGALPVGNGWAGDAPFRDGVTVTGTADVALDPMSRAPNVISANGGAGVRISGTGVATVYNSFIGTNAAGTAALGNREGVVVTAPRAEIARNVISGNAGAGVRVARAMVYGGADVYSNFIGTDVAGAAAVPNLGNGIEMFSWGVTVGGDAPPSRSTSGHAGNLISGNRGHGVLIAMGPGPVASVTGNYIGTDATGFRPLGNAGSGIYVSGSEVLIGGARRPASLDQPGNVISGNGGNGITITDPPYRAVFGTRVFGNAIGTNAARSPHGPGLGNAGHGVAIVNSARNEIGTTTSNLGDDYGNAIGFNAGSGVFVQHVAALAPSGAADRNRVLSNSIFSNGGPGIDLGADGVTPNDPLDADTGPNRLQNFPVLPDALASPGATTAVPVRFTLDSEPNTTYTVQFFYSPQPDPSGYGEGATLVGAVEVRTGADGHAESVASLRGLAAGYLTATATTFSAGTSEFSRRVRVSGPEVVGRSVFYNHSAFDGGDPAATPADDGAVATDKRAVLPWQTPSFANVTGYDKGINGVMVDVANLPPGVTLRAADFAFRIYRPGGQEWFEVQPWYGGWIAADSPTEVAIRRGAGVNGSDRVTIVWRDGRILNRWLQVTLLANPRTGLAAPDVFYFGNLMSETGNGVPSGATRLEINAMDLAGTRRAMGTQAVSVTNPYDHNRDAVVNAVDVALVRANRSRRLDISVSPSALPNRSGLGLSVVGTATAMVREDGEGGSAGQLIDPRNET